MQAPFDNIVQHLFHQPSLHSVTVEELENMARQHPYFAAAHFLLLKKMQDTAHPAFTDQLHKTAIYFSNPLWLQFLLQPETVSHFTVSDKSPFIDDEPAEKPLFFSGENHHEPAVATVSENKPSTTPAAESMHSDAVAGSRDSAEFSPEQTRASEPDSMMDIVTSVFSDADPLYDTFKDELARETSLHDNTPASDEPTVQNEDSTYSSMLEPIAAETSDSVNTETWSPRGEPATVPSEESVAPADRNPGAEQEPPEQAENETAVAPAAENPEAAERDVAASQYEDIATATQIPGNDETAGVPNPATSRPIVPVVEQNNIVPASETAIQPEESPETKAEEPATETELPAKTVIETPAAKDDLLFEPYHTVDYFASQGIKLGKTEADPKDKLGRQLKSFTDWLKTMKKLPQASIDKMLAEKEDSKVVEDAIHSIENKEVVTETMAEVFEKQGLYEKAVEIYQKLSLLNPSKSAYFAAKAEALKH